MDLTRRAFVRNGLVAAAAAGAIPVWIDPVQAAARRGSPLLVAVFLRGGADALHLAPPLRDADYRKLRGPLAIDEPLAFAPDFGLHPALEPLAPWVAREEVAVVLGAGSEHPTRSHFEAQDRMEAGVSREALRNDGWLARAFGAAPSDAFEVLALTGTLPATLQGSGAFAIDDPRQFGIPGASDAAVAQLEARYAAADDPFGSAGRAALAALADFRRRTGYAPPRRLRPTRGFGLAQSAQRLVDLEASGLPVRAVFLETSGWDTHQRQGGAEGPMARAIRDLGVGLAALRDGLAHRDLIVCVMTEFGRTVRPNGSGGTDHGHGSVMFVTGPRVRGGAFGDWPGLGATTLHEGRDLPIVTDYRHVLADVLHAHLGAPPAADVFPGFTPGALGLFG